MCCICVTRRLAIQQVVLSVVHEWLMRNGHSFGPPVFVDAIERAHLSREILILDLPSVGTQCGLLEAARQWRAAHRAGTLIVVGDMLHRDLLEPLVKLDGSIVWADLAFDAAHWRLRFEELTETVVVRHIQSDLLERIREYRSPQDVALILKLLEAAPRAAAVKVAELPSVRDTIESIRARGSLTALLREGHHPPLRHLMTVFQALWYGKLRTAGWSSDEIAQFLRFGVARTQMRHFNRTLGLGVKELRDLGYRALLDWTAEVVNTRWPADPTLPMLVAPLEARLLALRAVQLSDDHDEIVSSKRSLLSLLGVTAIAVTPSVQTVADWFTFVNS